MSTLDIIHFLGGPATIARKFDLSPSRVGNWSRRGIPWMYRAKVAELISQNGGEIPVGFLDPPKSKSP